MSASSFNSPEFTDAFKDYYYLKNRKYPDKFALKAVGDRYKLTGTCRTLLYRGVFSESENKEHIGKLQHNCENTELYIDTYNVLFTLLNYKLGRLVFIGTDNFCRDTGSLFGKIRKEEYFTDAAKQLVNFIQSLAPLYAVFYLDSPVSFSKGHCCFINKQIDEHKISGEARLVKSADQELKKIKNGLVCTTDSAIIKSSDCLVTDLSNKVIHYYYKPDLLNLRLLLESLLI